MNHLPSGFDFIKYNQFYITSLIGSVKKYYFDHQCQTDVGYINEILHKSESYDIISFDIFDTLGTRLFECPIDLFAVVEGCLKGEGADFQGFAQLRLVAEEQARIG